MGSRPSSVAIMGSVTEKVTVAKKVTLGLVAIILLVFAMPSAAFADTASDELAFFNMTNATRSANGLPALSFDKGAADHVARPWATSMASSGVLVHNPDYTGQLSQYATNSWTRLGENIGYGGSVGTVQDAFMASPGHRANILGDFNRIGIGVARSGNGTLWVSVEFIKGPAISSQPPSPGPDSPAPPAGQPAPSGPSASGAPAVGVGTSSAHAGYLVARADGFVTGFGSIARQGDLRGTALSQPIVGVSVTPSGRGYWMVASDGGIFSFGDAAFFGSTGSMRLNSPVAGMAASANGYWLFARDGGVFNFNAPFYGSAV